jgi:hypothetical protein
MAEEDFASAQAAHGLHDGRFASSARPSSSKSLRALFVLSFVRRSSWQSDPRGRYLVRRFK